MPGLNQQTFQPGLFHMVTIDTKATHTHCGGRILTAGNHAYCERCRAFAHDGEPIPSGTLRAVNVAAWDAQDPKSPPAEIDTEDLAKKVRSVLPFGVDVAVHPLGDEDGCPTVSVALWLTGDADPTEPLPWKDISHVIAPTWAVNAANTGTMGRTSRYIGGEFCWYYRP